MRSTKSFTTRTGRALRATSIVLWGAVRLALPVILLAAFAALTLAGALPANAHPPDDDHTHHDPKQAEDSKATASAPGDIHPEGDKEHCCPEHGSLANIGAKLSDPTSNVWALQLNLQGPTFYDGDVNIGSPLIGGNVIFQPILPFPLYGTGEKQWKLITRPIIPIIFSQPIPTALDEFKHVGGIGDIEIPLLLNLPESIAGHWIAGAGPVFEFPTSTNDSLGAQQYSIGPAVVLGYKTKLFTAVVFPNYFFGVGDRSDRKSSTPTTSKLSLLYGLTFNLPNAWQVGLNPTISYNHKALKNNKWDVPVGIFAAKMIKLGKFPFKIQAGLEYSVVSPDLFGKRAAFRFVLSPVIPGLVKKPIFGVS
jgi:hypothetical protein